MTFPIVFLVALAMALAPTVARAGQECRSTPYDCAMFDVGRGDFAAAIRLIEQVLVAAPTDLKALNLGGIALTGAGRIDEANARFRDAVRLDPRFYPALKNLAINEFTAGRLDDARRHFEEVLTLSSDDEITHVHLGEIEFDRKNPAAAL